MALTTLDIANLLQQLQTSEDINDLLHLLNAIVKWQNTTYQTKLPEFTPRQLAYFYGRIDHSYTTFLIAKKSGGIRTINAPKPTLKRIQRCLADVLTPFYTPATAVNGYVVGKSIVSNALLHTHKQFVLNIDLQNFFPNIKFGRVSAVLQLKPFSLKPRFAYLIAKYCCYEGVLPQGAPTSPILSNLICQKFDRRVSHLVSGHDITYSRYADDLTFSSDKPFENGFLNRLETIIQEEGFVINTNKVRLLAQNTRQEVTGLTVNQKANVSRDYVRELRAILHNWATLGYAEAQLRFLKKYEAPLSASKKVKTPELRNVLAGKLNYLRMVRGTEDQIVIRYETQYRQLCEGEMALPERKELPAINATVPHQPRQVVKFLRNFKIVNSSGFRELLHDPDVSDFDFLANLQQVNEQMPGLQHLLPERLYQKLAALVGVYNTAGIAYFNQYGVLPLQGRAEQKATSLSSLLGRKKAGPTIPTPPLTPIEPDKTVLEAANRFRIQIRVGSDYFNNLVLVNALKPTVKDLNETGKFIVTYQDDEETFAVNTEFFTDSWEVTKAIRSLVKDLALNPHYGVNSAKRAIVLRSAVIKRETETNSFFATVIYIRLLHSYVIDTNQAFRQRRLLTVRNRLWSLGEWSILFDTQPVGQQEHFFLSSPDNQPHRQPIEGVTHKLTFYHS